MKQSKYFHQRTYNLGFEDLANDEYSVYIKPGSRKGEYEIEMETETERCPTVIYTKEEMENVATFCRGFLLAWEFAQELEDKNDPS
jgi:uncharacterized protein Smg (DUF494 family)